jgi:anti-sigma factor RsiW
MRECLSEELLQSYVDGELSGETVEGVTAHLAACLACDANARELERENILVAAALAPEFERSVPTAQLRERIDTAIASEQFVSVATTERSGIFGGWIQSLSSLFTFTPQQAFGYASLVAILAFAAIFAITQRGNFQQTTGSEQVASVNVPANNSDLPTSPVEVSKPVDNGPATVQPVAVNSTARRTQRVSRERNNYIAAASRRAAESNHVKLLPGERSYLQTLAELDSTLKLDKGRMRPAIQAEYERNLAFVDRALAAARTAAKSNPNDPDAVEFMFSAYQSKVDLLNTVADARVYNRQR